MSTHNTTLNISRVIRIALTLTIALASIVASQRTVLGTLPASRYLYAWGENNCGQLGDGTTTPRSLPVYALTGSQNLTVAGGVCHSVALKMNGSVWDWGDIHYPPGGMYQANPSPRQVIGPFNGYTAIAAGGWHNLALKNDGTIFAWGQGLSGALGGGPANHNGGQVYGLTKVVAIAAGHNHSLAVRKDGSVWAWGMQEPSLGDGFTRGSTTRVPVSGLTQIVSVAAGDGHSLALDQYGVVWAWGSNSYGELGDGTTTDRSTPVRVQGFTNPMIAIAGGFGFSLALADDGTVWTWGNSQLTAAPVMGPAVAIAAGAAHALVLDRNGGIWSWGSNLLGQLGDGTLITRTKPKRVLAPGGVDYLDGVAAIGAGARSSFAIRYARY